MLGVLRDTTYRRLFAAQVLSLLGSGLATVALALLAYDLAGERAGAVLGTALAIKMVAYVGVAPTAGAFADRVPRRAMLVALDLARAAVALCLPFVDAVWQVYALVFVLQAGSAAFTPTFQATIPDVLPDEGEYTRALSLSRLAYDLESLASPALAAALLGLVGYPWLFAGNAAGFAASALLVLSVALPSPEPVPGPRRGAWDRTTRGLRLYLATPRLRGLLALNLAVAAAGAMVIVNTVALVRAGFGLGQDAVAWALAAYGAGSMAAALALPRLLERAPDRAAMLGGAGLLGAGLLLVPLVPSWPALLPVWAVLGVGNALVLTPSGRLLRRSAHPADRPALFAAQFALSHACWLLAYPLAGWVAAGSGATAAALTLAALVAAGLAGAALLWPAADPEELEHGHENLPVDHPHLREGHPAGPAAPPNGPCRHRHAYVVDDLHPAWPRGA